MRCHHHWPVVAWYLVSTNQGESISPQAVTVEMLTRMVEFLTYEDAVTMAEAADKAAEYWAADKPNVIRMSTADILKDRAYTGSSTE